MNYPEHLLEDIKAALDLPTVVEAYTKVTRSGSTYKCCCLFHDEKTPSMALYSDHFKCYGSCGAGGDVFKLVMEKEGLNFPEAVKHCAAIAGIALPELKPLTDVEKKRLSEREETFAALAVAQEWFLASLKADTPEAAAAREAIEARGLSSVEGAFGIGYAPNAGCMAHLATKGFSRAVALRASLVGEREGGVYQRFRNRITFPVIDRHGRVAGFSGRTMDPDHKAKDIPKYLNSAEVPGIFEKRTILYGLDVARGAIQKSRRAIIVEGHADCASMHAHEFNNTVAVQGTAFTVEHIAQLKRICDEVVLAFDGDAAGRKAAERALPLLLDAKLPARVAILPEGKDPDDIVRSTDRDCDERWLASEIDGAVPHFDWWIEQTLAAATSDALRLMALERDLVPLLARLDSFALEIYEAKAATLWKVKAATLHKAVVAQAKKVVRLDTFRDEKRKQATKDAEPEEEQYAGQIIENRTGTCIIRKKKDGDLYPHTIFSGHIAVKQRMQVKDEGEFLVCTMTCPKRKIEQELVLPPTAWISLQSFKAALPTIDFALTAGVDDLERLKMHLSYSEAQRVIGVRELGLHRVPGGARGEWCAVMSNKAFMPDGSESDILMRYEDEKEPSGMGWKVGAIKPPTPAELERFVSSAFHFYMSDLAGALWAWMFAAPFKERFKQNGLAAFPILYLWGEAGSGKSSVNALLMQFYSGGQTSRWDAGSMTPYPAVFLPTTTNGPVPMMLEEVKPSLMSSEKTKQVISIIQRTYDGVGTPRGTRTGGIRTLIATAPLIVAGEDISSITSVEERMIELYLPKIGHKETQKQYLTLKGLDLEQIGLDYLRWTLTVSDDEMLAEHERCMTRINERFTGRVRDNVAMTVLGLSFFERYLRAKGVKSVDEEAWDSLACAVEGGQLRARYQDSEGGRNKNAIDKILEALAEMAAYGVLRKDTDFLVECDTGDPGEGTTYLYLWLPRVWQQWGKWIRETGWEKENEALSRKVFKRILKDQDYYPDKENKDCRKRLPGNLDTHAKRMICLRLDKMIEMNLEVEPFIQVRPGIPRS